jgi:hypothetical protein
MIPAVTDELRNVSLDADAPPPAELHDVHPSGNGHEATPPGAEGCREPSAGNHVAQARVRSTRSRDQKAPLPHGDAGGDGPAPGCRSELLPPDWQQHRLRAGSLSLSRREAARWVHPQWLLHAHGPCLLLNEMRAKEVVLRRCCAVIIG